MPRFFFRVLDDLDTEDEEGAELPDLDAARARAAQEARALMCYTLTEDGHISLHHRIDIEDEQHGVVATVRFADAVEIEQ